MGFNEETGQILIGAIFLLVACAFFLFSVYDIAQGWRDRAKLQQTVDTAALSSAALMSDILTMMEIYNLISLQGIVKIPQLIAVGECIDAMRMLMETYEAIGSLTAMLGNDTFYPIHIVQRPIMDAYFCEAPQTRFFIKYGRDPRNRVIKLVGYASSISPRYLLKRFIPAKSIFEETVFFATAKAGVYRQEGIIPTYVPVLIS